MAQQTICEKWKLVATWRKAKNLRLVKSQLFAFLPRLQPNLAPFLSCLSICVLQCNGVPLIFLIWFSSKIETTVKYVDEYYYKLLHCSILRFTFTQFQSNQFQCSTSRKTVGHNICFIPVSNTDWTQNTNCDIFPIAPLGPVTVLIHPPSYTNKDT